MVIFMLRVTWLIQLFTSFKTCILWAPVRILSVITGLRLKRCQRFGCTNWSCPRFLTSSNNSSGVLLPFLAAFLFQTVFPPLFTLFPARRRAFLFDMCSRSKVRYWDRWLRCRIGAILPIPVSPTYYHSMPFCLLMQNVTKTMWNSEMSCTSLWSKKGLDKKEIQSLNGSMSSNRLIDKEACSFLGCNKLHDVVGWNDCLM